jgi:hypothetical protein
MPDPAVEREHLAKAELDITEGERRVTSQILRVEEMRLGGHDVSEAEKLLLTLRQTLATWYEHREAILQELSRHEIGRPH